MSYPYRSALSALAIATATLLPAAGAWAQAPLTKLYLQESASRDVEMPSPLSSLQAATPAVATATTTTPFLRYPLRCDFAMVFS